MHKISKFFPHLDKNLLIHSSLFKKKTRIFISFMHYQHNYILYAFLLCQECNRGLNHEVGLMSYKKVGSHRRTDISYILIALLDE